MLKYWLYIWNSNGISLYRSGTNICDQGIVTLAKWYKLSYWLDLNIDSTSYITPKVSARGFQIEDSSTWLHKEAVTWYLLYKQGHLSLSLYIPAQLCHKRRYIMNLTHMFLVCTNTPFVYLSSKVAALVVNPKLKKTRFVYSVLL